MGNVIVGEDHIIQLRNRIRAALDLGEEHKFTLYYRSEAYNAIRKFIADRNPHIPYKNDDSSNNTKRDENDDSLDENRHNTDTNKVIRLHALMNLLVERENNEKEVKNNDISNRREQTGFDINRLNQVYIAFYGMTYDQYQTYVEERKKYDERKQKNSDLETSIEELTESTQKLKGELESSSGENQALSRKLKFLIWIVVGLSVFCLTVVASWMYVYVSTPISSMEILSPKTNDEVGKSVTLNARVKIIDHDRIIILAHREDMDSFWVQMQLDSRYQGEILQTIHIGEERDIGKTFEIVGVQILGSFANQFEEGTVLTFDNKLVKPITPAIRVKKTSHSIH